MEDVCKVEKDFKTVCSMMLIVTKYTYQKKNFFWTLRSHREWFGLRFWEPLRWRQAGPGAQRGAGEGADSCVCGPGAAAEDD